jgi:hypothetical protein
MKFNLFPLCIAFLSATGLVSCGLVQGGSGGTAVHNPTVEEMAQMEKRWGLEPHGTRPRFNTPAGDASPASSSHYAAPQNTVPETAPLPQTQAAAPPVLEPPSQVVTPAQIQKLKN